MPFFGGKFALYYWYYTLDKTAHLRISKVYFINISSAASRSFFDWFHVKINLFKYSSVLANCCWWNKNRYYGFVCLTNETKSVIRSIANVFGMLSIKIVIDEHCNEMKKRCMYWNMLLTKYTCIRH